MKLTVGVSEMVVLNGQIPATDILPTDVQIILVAETWFIRAIFFELLFSKTSIIPFVRDVRDGVEVCLYIRDTLPEAIIAVPSNVMNIRKYGCVSKSPEV